MLNSTPSPGPYLTRPVQWRDVTNLLTRGATAIPMSLATTPTLVTCDRLAPRVLDGAWTRSMSQSAFWPRCLLARSDTLATEALTTCPSFSISVRKHPHHQISLGLALYSLGDWCCNNDQKFNLLGPPSTSAAAPVQSIHLRRQWTPSTHTSGSPGLVK